MELESKSSPISQSRKLRNTAICSMSMRKDSDMDCLKRGIIFEWRKVLRLLGWVTILQVLSVNAEKGLNVLKHADSTIKMMGKKMVHWYWNRYKSSQLVRDSFKINSFIN
jgi:hypothetical protein